MRTGHPRFQLSIYLYSTFTCLDRNLKVHYPDKSTKEEQLYEEIKQQKKDDRHFNETEFSAQLRDKRLGDVLGQLSKQQKTQILLEIADLLQGDT